MAEKQDTLRYAKDVLLVYDWLGRVPTSEDLPPSAMQLWEFAQTPGNRKEFFAMAKAASTELTKANKDNTPDDMLRKEKLTVAELKDRVKSAIAESQAMEV